MPQIDKIEEGLQSSDESQRWTAASAAGDLIPTKPRSVWNLILKYGSYSNEDVRSAVASCMLEHLLESNFEEYFPLLKTQIIEGNILLTDTFRRCWKFG